MPAHLWDAETASRPLPAIGRGSRMQIRCTFVLIAITTLLGCKGVRYIPAELEGTATNQLTKIMPGEPGFMDTPDFMLSSVDGVRTASSIDGASPAIYVEPGAHQFVIKGKYHKRRYYNKGARVGSGVVTSPGYAPFASGYWEQREGSLELQADSTYTIEELYRQLPARDG